MTDPSDSAEPFFWTPPSGPRLPRIALMGEFSAGKSTLANLMIGSSPLPEQVVATQLPPVWVSHGTQGPLLVDVDGNETPCAFDALQDTVGKETAFIRIFSTDKILTRCEIIDMPGISDPNMASSVWERMMPFADGVIWCTPSTQAWRQSEAAVWEDIDAVIRDHSILVMTRADMLLTERDRNRVFKRVQTEAGALFSEMTMMSLTKARDGKEDEALWEESGADDFVGKFLSTLDRINTMLPQDPQLETPDVVAGKEPVPAAEKIVPCKVAARPKLKKDPPTIDPVSPDPMSFLPKFS